MNRRVAAEVEVVGVALAEEALWDTLPDLVADAVLFDPGVALARLVEADADSLTAFALTGS